MQTFDDFVTNKFIVDVDGRVGRVVSVMADGFLFNDRMVPGVAVEWAPTKRIECFPAPTFLDDCNLFVDETDAVAYGLSIEAENAPEPEASDGDH